ncbi:MAG: prolyl oligopeptidase family serine peptidase [Pseudomonadota bacterium]|nr:prolyl oligopeptidase family serine peptidase [Pseudomonadota bacterium]
MNNLRRLMQALGAFAGCGIAMAGVCETEDFTTRVNGAGECVVIQTFKADTAVAPRALVVWLHGDHSGGGPATSHLRPARDVAQRFAAQGVVAVALWRPGYADAQGNASGGDLHERSDHYTAANMAVVAGAIQRLREHWKPQRVLLVGHSGGAATVAINLGMQPGIADAALLLACPCDLRAWRSRRAWWPRSEDPMKWASSVGSRVTILALTGSADDNTSPRLAQAYVETVREKGTNARFESVEGASHNSILAAPEVMVGVASLLE